MDAVRNRDAQIYVEESGVMDVEVDMLAKCLIADHGCNETGNLCPVNGPRAILLCSQTLAAFSYRARFPYVRESSSGGTTKYSAITIVFFACFLSLAALVPLQSALLPLHQNSARRFFSQVSLQNELRRAGLQGGPLENPRQK